MKTRIYSSSSELTKRFKKVALGCVSSELGKYNYPHTLFYSRRRGGKIHDLDGHEYLSFTLRRGPHIPGHSPLEILKAIHEYSQKIQLFAEQHLKEIELAEKFNTLVTSAELIRFSLCGLEAVQTGFRITRPKTERKKSLSIETLKFLKKHFTACNYSS